MLHVGSFLFILHFGKKKAKASIDTISHLRREGGRKKEASFDGPVLQ